MDDKQFNELIEAIDIRIDARFDEFRETMATKEDVDRIYTMIDSISKRLDIDEGERAAIISQTNRSEERIDKLDKRVTRLEKATI
ncbi:MAG: hypothetical protein LBL84_00370 [Candidatus Nomurabacteria bacterium]|jgi:hypothetical protein|nr:hypothetical protein [Candidatus Nomurabacteria bacterium]